MQTKIEEKWITQNCVIYFVHEYPTRIRQIQIIYIYRARERKTLALIEKLRNLALIDTPTRAQKLD